MGQESAPGVEYPETVALPRVRLNDPVGQVVVEVLRTAGARVAACSEHARRGESAGIHRLRTTVRRLRSDLRSLEGLVDRRWREDICGELKWLAGQLGEVRDLDILGARLEQGIEASKRGHASEFELMGLMTSLEGRRAQAARSLADVLRCDRYLKLVMNIELSTEQPPLSDAASVPCHEALPEIAVASWRRIRRAGRALKKSDPDEHLHEFRKRVKRARYIAELIAPILGRRALCVAGRYVRLLTRIQDTLGEHQDAVIAATEIERSLNAAPDDHALHESATSLLEIQRHNADFSRAHFFKIWKKFDRKKSRRWLHISRKIKATAC